MASAAARSLDAVSGRTRRCSLSGGDANRAWARPGSQSIRRPSPLARLHPRQSFRGGDRDTSFGVPNLIPSRISMPYSFLGVPTAPTGRGPDSRTAAYLTSASIRSPRSSVCDPRHTFCKRRARLSDGHKSLDCDGARIRHARARAPQVATASAAPQEQSLARGCTQRLHPSPGTAKRLFSSSPL